MCIGRKKGNLVYFQLHCHKHTFLFVCKMLNVTNSTVTFEDACGVGCGLLLTFAAILFFLQILDLIFGITESTIDDV